MSKKFAFIVSAQIVKNGRKSQKQKYLCKSCGKQFVFRQIIDNQALYKDYVFGKQTLKQLSAKHKISVRTVHRRLSSVGSTRVISLSKNVVVLMDTTYWALNAICHTCGFGMIIKTLAYLIPTIIWKELLPTSKPNCEITMGFQKHGEWYL